MGQRATAERAHEGGVPLEPARGEDHAAASSDVEPTVRALQAHPDHRTVGDQEVDRTRVDVRLDAPIEAAAQQPPDQGQPGAALVVLGPPSQLSRW